MNTQQNVATVRKGYEAFSRGDLDGLLMLLADNIEWTWPGPPELPRARTRRGRQQVAEFVKKINDVFEIERCEPKAFMSDGSRVVVLGEAISRIKATGKVLHATWAHAFTLKDGKVLRFEEYMYAAPAVPELQTPAMDSRCSDS